MRVGMLGAGTVGSSLLDLLARHGPELTDRLGEPLEVVAVVVRDAARPRRLSLPDRGRVTDDAATVVDDPSVEVVVEVMGGTEPALAYALRALRRGASLVTANKALIAAHAPALFAAAGEGGGDVLFEAAVGAAVPVIGAMQQALSAARVSAIAGVLNGSTNYLLARMADGVAFADAVRQASAQGYLEADPGDDVDGHDAARKIAILASLAAGRHYAPEAVACRGLGGVGPADMAIAAALGMAVKLLAVAERGAGDGDFSVWVAPALVPADHPFAAVHGAANAVAVAAEPGGETLLAGQGAGGAPTAQAVAGDLLAAARRRRAGQRGPLYRWRAAPAAGTAVPMPAYPYVVRVGCAPAGRERLERAAALVEGVGRTLAAGPEAVAVATPAMGRGEADALAVRLLALPGAREVGAPLVRWSGLARRDGAEAWWRVPALAPAAVAAAGLGRGQGR